MSFFDFMSRMVEGKPIFDEENKNDATKNNASPLSSEPISAPLQQEPPKDGKGVIRKGDESSFPVVYVKHVTTRINGKNMEVYGRILNTWPTEIMLDKIRICGATREIDNFLNGGQEREFLLYKGPMLANQRFEAQLDYRTQNERDYFESIHDVTFMYHDQEKLYSVNEMRLRKPIRDIYG